MDGSISIGKKGKFGILATYIVVELLLLIHFNPFSEVTCTLALTALSAILIHVLAKKFSKDDGSLVVLLFVATALSSPECGKASLSLLLPLYTIVMAIEFMKGNLFIVSLATGAIASFYPPFIIFLPLIMVFTMAGSESWSKTAVVLLTGALLPMIIYLGVIFYMGASPADELQRFADSVGRISTPFSRMHIVAGLLLILYTSIIFRFNSGDNSLYKSKSHLYSTVNIIMSSGSLLLFLFYNDSETTKELLCVYIAAPLSVALCGMLSKKRGKEVEWMFNLLLLLLIMNTLASVVYL